MASEPLFREIPLETYQNWRMARLFGLYLSMKAQGELHPNDAAELEKVTEALASRSFPEKIRFYWDLGGHREEFRPLLGAYQTWRIARLFSLYLSLKAKKELSPDDANELEQITEALMNKPLPDKVNFGKNLGSHQEEFKAFYVTD